MLTRNRVTLSSLALSFLFSVPGFASGGIDTSLTFEERRELDERIGSFYASPHDPSLMDRRPPKFGINEGRFISPNAFLRLDRHPEAAAPADHAPRDILLDYAQAKGNRAFNDDFCKKFLKKKFPGMHCGEKHAADANIEDFDRVSDLTPTWLRDDEIIYDLDGIPATGQTSAVFWSDDYWRTRWGLTSYRYAEGAKFPEYHQAVNSYAQPKEWTALMEEIDPLKIAERILTFSPSEKYDITVGDESFTLTHEQKIEGEDVIGENGKIEDWYGLCHGWAPASVFAPAALHAVKTVGARGIPVTWFPHDIRSMVSLAWSNGDYDASFAGSRCEVEKPTKHKNGRLSQQECFDTNPATMHLALGNLLGKLGQSFVMDAAFDAEVWNQPILSYELTYFNPVHPDAHSAEWQKVAVDYDDQFKAIDRFQTPLTRGRREGSHRYDDSGIKKIVGVIATVVYLTEIDAVHGDHVGENETARVTYTYDLELHEKDGKLIAKGGEWHTNTHPDFLWVPHRGSVATSHFDNDKEIEFGLETKPVDSLTAAAKGASKGEAYPLCQVVKALVGKSSGSDLYRCR